MKDLERKLGYSFQNKKLLDTALTHSSYANEKRRSAVKCNERLEFLGDSILGMVVAEYLYKNCPEMPEGKMTKLRAELVCEESLHEVAQQLGLGEYLYLGHGEEQTGGRTRTSILADAVEAIFAAIYLDGGRGQAEKVISEFILSKLENGVKIINHDYKTTLQEIVQQGGSAVLSYELIGESGPDHNKLFTMQVSVNGNAVGSGSGKSKKEAEQFAAKCALEGFEK